MDASTKTYFDKSTQAPEVIDVDEVIEIIDVDAIVEHKRPVFETFQAVFECFVDFYEAVREIGDLPC